MLKNIVVTNPRFNEINGIVAQIAEHGVPSDAEIIYGGRRNTVYRFTFRGVDLTVKAFHKPKFINSWVYTTFRKSKARRSFENASRLNDLGFHSPGPVGYSEERKGGRLRRSYYTCLYLPSKNMRYCDMKPDADSLLKALAAEMGKLHRAGVFNKDYSPGNILYTGSADEGYTFHYVDVNRMEFDIHDRDKLSRNFRALSLNRNQLTALARYYAMETGDDPDRMTAEALSRLADYERLQRRKRFLKRILTKLHLRRDTKKK